MQSVDRAVALYKEIGQYIDEEVILDEFHGLLKYGYYAQTVELIMLKVRSTDYTT